MARRRKPILCVLCEKKETYEVNGVCLDCQEHYKRGIEAKRRAGTGDYIPVMMRHGLLSHHLGDLTTRRWVDIPGLLLLLCNPPIGRIPGDAQYQYVGDKPNGFDHRTSMLLTETQYQAASDLVTLINQKVETAYKEGYRKGSSLLVNLATGNVTMDEINAAALKREEHKS